MSSESGKDNKLKFQVDKTLEDSNQYRVYKDYSYKIKHKVQEKKGIVEKFYIIQLLERSDEPGKYNIFSRWGNIGNIGHKHLGKQLNNIDEAIIAFDKRFQDKVGVSWHNRHKLTDETASCYSGEEEKGLEKKVEEEEEEEESKKENNAERKVDKAKMDRDLNELSGLLKDICFEINILDEEKDASEKIKKMSDNFFKIFKKYTNEDVKPIKDVQTIKDYSNMLKEFNKYVFRKESEA